MTVYGDLDVSILDELPPGRQPITTKRKSPTRMDLFWAFLMKKLKEGRQAYVIYPLVEESEKVDAKSVKSRVRAPQDPVARRKDRTAARAARRGGEGAGDDGLSRGGD